MKHDLDDMKRNAMAEATNVFARIGASLMQMAEDERRERLLAHMPRRFPTDDELRANGLERVGRHPLIFREIPKQQLRIVRGDHSVIN